MKWVNMYFEWKCLLFSFSFWMKTGNLIHQFLTLLFMTFCFIVIGSKILVWHVWGFLFIVFQYISNIFHFHFIVIRKRLEQWEFSEREWQLPHKWLIESRKESIWRGNALTNIRNEHAIGSSKTAIYPYYFNNFPGRKKTRNTRNGYKIP